MARSDVPLQKPSNVALVNWARERKLGPVDLDQYAGFNRSHASLLLNARCEVTAETLGRLVRAFGTMSVMQIIRAYEADGDTQSNLA